MVSLAFLHLCRQAGHPVHADYRLADRPLVFEAGHRLASVEAVLAPDDHVALPAAPVVVQVNLAVVVAADSEPADSVAPPAVPVVDVLAGPVVALAAEPDDRAVQLVAPAVALVVQDCC